VLHEIVAHWDVHYASPLRRISIWEVHVHNYMATVPLYLFMLIVLINWDVAVKAVTFQWNGQFTLNRLLSPPGSAAYLPEYIVFMTVLCVFPYLEENIRCLRYARSVRIEESVRADHP